jgi:hypothetical protein
MLESGLDVRFWDIIFSISGKERRLLCALENPLVLSPIPTALFLIDAEPIKWQLAF